MTLCAKCKKNPAVFFITKMENGKTTSEGLCLSCAKELGIAPINQMIDNFGVSDEELENINNHERKIKDYLIEEMKKIENCLECGQCIKKCPYELNTPELLKKNYEDYKKVLAGEVSVN